LQRDRIRAAVRELLAAIGENPDRPELRATPDKVADAYAEFFKGVGEDTAGALGDLFEVDSDELVLLKDIELVSICEHHLLPFTGLAHIAYLPSGRVAGLGRLPRLVEILASRPQLQEALTGQIADALESELQARGVLVVIEARHQCVASRGARQPEVNTITLAARGEYRDPVQRAEVMGLISK
jgi:GTP cyclohydrolase IA